MATGHDTGGGPFGFTPCAPEATTVVANASAFLCCGALRYDRESCREARSGEGPYHGLPP